MTQPSPLPPRPMGLTTGTHRPQRGLVVFIALIVLVAMTLAGLAVMRASGNSILTAGNLAFRQNATISGDAGIESALAWLRVQGPVTLESSAPASGYYALWFDDENSNGVKDAGEDFDPVTSALWKTSGRTVKVGGGAPDNAGNSMQYVIHRMCSRTGAVMAPGAPAGQECVTLDDPGKGGPKMAGAKPLIGTSQVYYRITARVDGPKNTVSYVQAMVN